MNAIMRAHSLGEHHLKTPDHLKMATPEQMAELHELYLRDHNGHLSPTGFDARKYALARMRAQPRPTRWVRSDLDDEDIADAYAMACVMGCASRGAFWAWAQNVGMRPA